MESERTPGRGTLVIVGAGVWVGWLEVLAKGGYGRGVGSGWGFGEEKGWGEGWERVCLRSKGVGLVG